MKSQLPLFCQIISRAYMRYRAWKVDPTRLLRNYFRGESELSVVQIGAYDGISGDAIRPLLVCNQRWQALLVEPVPHLFARLRGNYGPNPRFQFVNAAIAKSEGELPYFYISEEVKKMPEMPHWVDQCAGFDRAHIIRHCGIKIEQFIVETSVPCMSLRSLLEQHDVQRVDLLAIDAERFDWQILKQLDLSVYRPRAILFEVVHLSDVAKAEALAFLRPHYSVLQLDRDWLCLGSTAILK